MEALLYEKLDDKKVKCGLCNHRCVIKDGLRGICGVRENEGGVLKTLVYGKLIAKSIDPIEKKPIFHVMPGSLSYSIATVGCNFRCLFCQNADISQMPLEKNGLIMGDFASPEDVVDAAIKANCKSIAYTYTEPTVFFEFAYNTAKLAHEKKLKNIFVSNGYMTAEALQMIGPYLDAANIDLKAFNNNFYKKICKAKLEPVKNTLKLIKSLGILLEVTTLIIPELNDDEVELEQLASFIAESLGTETPWHISRFYPCYKLLDSPPTPVKTLEKAREIGNRAGLKYVYTGNVPGETGENTFCPECGKLIIQRLGFDVKKNLITDSRCPECGTQIYGIGLQD